MTLKLEKWKNILRDSISMHPILDDYEDDIKQWTKKYNELWCKYCGLLLELHEKDYPNEKTKHST